MSTVAGALISVELIARPTSEAAEKTIIRLFRKDPDVARRERRQSRIRPSMQTWRRGGNYWHHQMKTVAPVKLNVGAKYKVPATLDVLRDLESVKRFVKVGSSK